MVCARGLLIIFCFLFKESVSAGNETFTCNDRQFACMDKKFCIPHRWQCDGEPDCKDKSDEKNCRYKPCKEDQFRCATQKCVPKTDRCDGFKDCPGGDDEDNCNKNQIFCTKKQFQCLRGKISCVDKSKVCDGHDDCSDMSDEANCPTVKCGDDEFKCAGGGCISATFKCDGKKDCEDNSDEKNCKPMNKCASDQFKCLTGVKQCIDLSKRCDSYRDCPDGTDEQECPNAFMNATECPVKGDFYCGIVGRCVSNEWRCDGEIDCPNGADERNCVSVTCPPPKMACNRGNKCLHPTQKCDGKQDCPDGSDEEHCPAISKIDGCKGKFMCGSGGLRCVDWSQVCDGQKDCHDGADERPDGNSDTCKKNPCLNLNGGCTHNCQNRYSHHVCTCPPGLELQKDNKTCIDIDECSIWGSCAQKCENTKGSYKCSCDIGYVVDPKNKSNCLANTDKSILLVTNEFIREYRTKTADEFVIASDLLGAESVDYDIRSTPRRVFWTQTTMPGVYTTTFGGKSKPKPTDLFSKKGRIPEGIAYDWTHGLMYMSDIGNKKISVFNVSAPEMGIADIATGDIEEPRPLAVDPLNGWLYWSDWGKSPKISKIGMDGKYRTVLVDSQIVYPNALALDMPQGRLYWCDAKLHSISTVDLDGKDRRLVYNDTEIYPFAMSVFEDRVYWSDWKLDSVMSVNKFHATSYTVLFDRHHINGIRILHKLMQPEIPNRCINHLCSHFCLPSPRVGHIRNDPLYTCACPENMVLNSDDRTCRAAVPLITAEPGKPVGPTKMPSSNNDTLSLTEKRVGHIAGLAIGVIFLVFAIVAAMLLIVYRIYTKRNIRSMNFDNPVYRKANGEVDSEAQYPINCGPNIPNNRSVRTPIWTGMDNDAVEA